MDLKKIKLDNVSLDFKVYNVERRIFKKLLINKVLKKKKKHSDVISALKNISFEANQGDKIGIIGKNGSGKTSLLRILSGIYQPSEGSINVNGSVKNVLEVSSSGQLDDTVENNIMLIGLLHGYKKSEILKKKNAIIEFSGLQDFLHLPMISCSTGMQLRILFSTLYHFESDIYVIDEFISTGDEEFQNKGMLLLETYIQNKILVFASHNLNLIRNKCSKVLVLDKGEQKFFGNVEQGIKIYKSL